MLITDLANSGAAPALEQMMRFAAQRQRLLSHNIANIDTPNFQTTDVSPSAFQSQLKAAIDRRRDTTGGEHGSLQLGSSEQVATDAAGNLVLTPSSTAGSGNILYHDRNDRDLERMMQGLAENTMSFRVASDLYRRHQDILRAAIAQRV